MLVEEEKDFYLNRLIKIAIITYANILYINKIKPVFKNKKISFPKTINV